MQNYFKEYMQAKLALFYMTGETYWAAISQKEAKKNNVKYTNNDLNINKKVNVCFHAYDPIAEKSWHVFNIDDAMISFSNYWKINIDEEEDKTKDYQKDYLELCLLVLKMSRECYSFVVNTEIADRMGIKYVKDEVNNGKVRIYTHYFEVAGEKFWQLLNINEEKVAASVINTKQAVIKKKLLELDNIK